MKFIVTNKIYWHDILVDEEVFSYFHPNTAARDQVKRQAFRRNRLLTAGRRCRGDVRI